MRKQLEITADGISLYDEQSLESLGCHLFFGEVDSDTAFEACEFILKSNLLNTSNDPITIFMNTIGGDCADAFSVIDLMETSRIPVATVGTGAIMSMGVLLVSGGKHGLRTLTKNAEVMAHQFASHFSGKQHELVATHIGHEMLERRFIKHFLAHSTMNEKTIRDVLFAPTDRYLSPKECKKYGLVDNITEYFMPPVKNRRAGQLA